MPDEKKDCSTCRYEDHRASSEPCCYCSLIQSESDFEKLAWKPKEMTVPEMISKVILETATEDFIRENAKAAIEKAIKNIIDSSVSYGQVNKAIKEGLEESLKVERLDLPSYGYMITEMVRAKVMEITSDLIAGQLSKEVEDMLNLAPKEIKLSTLIKEMVDAKKEEDPQAYDEDLVTCEVEETEYDTTWIGIDPDEEGTARYNCPIQLMVNKKTGQICNAFFNEPKYRLGEKQAKLWANSWESRFRAMVACQTKLIIDDFETSFSYD